MRYKLLLFLALLSFVSCQINEDDKRVKPTDWESRRSEVVDYSGFFHGKTYLPVYSHIYHMYEHRTFDLTITVSIRNTSLTDSVYILKADYFNTEGDNIRQYIKSPIYLKPMETVEIVLAEDDREGGSGANFMFDWAVVNDHNSPLFEAVMISTYSQQGLSFATRGVQVFE